MKSYLYPPKHDWKNLMQRPVKDLNQLSGIVEQVFEEIRSEGDSALIKYTREFDKVILDSVQLDNEALSSASGLVSEPLQEAIRLAARNIETFHASQAETEQVIETSSGVFCWRESRPIERVGIYIPGGTAPLFSTVLMLAIPARLAGCREIVLCTPPGRNGQVDPVILFAAHLTGITSVFRLGGMQAIGAMCFGTESVPRVDKIFGPGNQYVTAAKQIAQNYGVAIDMPAGPSEVLIIADKTAVPAFVAADLVSQAEHGGDSQVILLSNNKEMIGQSLRELERQLRKLPRKDFAAQALSNSKAILLNSLEECIVFSNQYAPEHLIIATHDARSLARQVDSAGSVFLGNFSCESAGDYASGTNHTLPTNGYARNYSGVSLDSFVKKITFQEITPEGIRNIGPAIERMAEAEQLFAHKNAVTLRLTNTQ
jgi:histidinol dehydrogenase